MDDESFCATISAWLAIRAAPNVILYCEHCNMPSDQASSHYRCPHCGHCGGEQEPDAIGDCYPVAFNLCSVIEGAVLCHGAVFHPLVGWHGHAWVEVDGVAIDRSNGFNTAMPAGVYRAIGRASDVVEYDHRASMRHAILTGNYGPWSELPPSTD